MQESVTKEIEKYKEQKANMLIPSTHIDGLSDWHKPVIDEVFLSPERDAGDAYYDTITKKYRLTKQGLIKLSVTAGVMWHPTGTRRIDNRQDRDYCAFRAIGGIRKADGTPVWLKAEYDLDFEVVADEIEEQYEKKASDYERYPDKNPWWGKMSPADQKAYIAKCVRRDVLQKRKHKAKLCESGAKTRVVRELLGLKSSYTKEELAKPFVMVRIVFSPNMDDPEVKKRLLDASVQAMLGVYGLPPEQQQVIDIPPDDVADVPDNDPEMPEPTEPEQPPEGDPARVDFENADRDTQINVLKHNAGLKGYDLGQLKKPFDRFTKNQLVQFFDMLDEMVDAADDDDIPF